MIEEEFTCWKAFLRASLWISPAIWTGLFPLMRSQPEGSALQKNWVSRPIRRDASSVSKPTMRGATSQVAPQGAPRVTSMRAIFPLTTAIENSGEPNRSPYGPRQTCLDRLHQVGGVRTPLILNFFPEATTGRFLSRHITARA